LGLARAAFLVRMAVLEQAMGAEDRAGFWIGAVVADDVRALARHPILDGAGWIGVGGKEPLRSLYVRALATYTSRHISRLDDALCERCSALGALSIALLGVRDELP